MTNPSKIRNRRAKNRKSSREASPLFEPKLVPRLGDTSEQNEALPVLPPSEAERVESLIHAEDSLRSQLHTLELVLTSKLPQHTGERLHEWENEGGKLAHPPSARALGKAEHRKRLRIWSRRKDLR
jgi:hypothetical protein